MWSRGHQVNPAVLVALVTCLLLSAGSSAAAKHPEEPDRERPELAAELEARVESLTDAGEYAEAAARAQELLAFRQSDPEIKPFQIVDAKWLVHTLELAAALSGRERREFGLLDSLGTLARGCWDEGRYSEAVAAKRRQLEILRRVLGPEHPEIASCLDDIGNIQDEQGELRQGEVNCRQALEMRRRIFGAEHPDIAGSLNSMALFARKSGHYEEAERLQRASIDTYRRTAGDEHPDLPASVANLALLLQLMGRYEAAEDVFRDALSLQTEIHGERHPDTATILDNFGVLYWEIGDYAKAEPLLRRALALRREALGPDHPYVATGLNNLGVLLADSGAFTEAQELYAESLEIRRRHLAPGHPNIGITLSNLGELYWHLREYEHGEELYREAYEILETSVGSDHPVVVTCLGNLACLLAEAGDTEEAIRIKRDVARTRTRTLGDAHLDTAIALANLGSTLAFEGRHASAESALVAARSVYNRASGPGHHLAADNLQSLAQVEMARGRYEAAEALLVDAASSYDAARLRTPGGAARSLFAASPYGLLATVRLRLGRPNEAWEAAERMRGRSLADFLAEMERRELTAVEAAREDSLKASLVALEDRMGALLEARLLDREADVDSEYEEARNELLLAEAEWSAFRRDLQRAYPVSEGASFPLERVQTSLREGEALVGWLDIAALSRGGDPIAYGYVVSTSGQVDWFELQSRWGGDEPRSAEWHADRLIVDLADPLTPETELNRRIATFSELRLHPLMDAVGDARGLILVPSGPMLGLPIEILVDADGTSVGERFAVSYAPSATVHTWLAERSAGHMRVTARRALLLGDPPFKEEHLAAATPLASTRATSEAGPRAVEPEQLRRVLEGDRQSMRLLPRLQGTREEIAGLAELCGDATVLVGADASEDMLHALAASKRLADYDVIHLATHAIVDDDRPGRSSLILSQVGLADPFDAVTRGGRIYDGRLTAGEVVKEWELDAELVALSACESGLGREVEGEGYLGFTHAFLQAGARSLLASLWKVDDRATSLLMIRLYENLFGSYDDARMGEVAEPMSKAAALREAKLWLQRFAEEGGRCPYAHPYFWSAFVLIGDRS